MAFHKIMESGCRDLLPFIHNSRIPCVLLVLGTLQLLEAICCHSSQCVHVHSSHDWSSPLTAYVWHFSLLCYLFTSSLFLAWAVHVSEAWNSLLNLQKWLYLLKICMYMICNDAFSCFWLCLYKSSKNILLFYKEFYCMFFLLLIYTNQVGI